jgi:hypothetical protein
MDAAAEKDELVELTADIVSAYVSNNTVVATDLPALINNVFDALKKASTSGMQLAKEELRPAVPIKKSVTAEYIICLEDGKKIQVAQTSPSDPLRSLAGGVPREVGAAARLSDGRAQLCGCPVRSC